MDNRRVGFTASAFDLFHSGHVAMLKEARSNCDYMIVGLQTDPTIDRPNKNKPIQSVFERYVQLEGCKYINEIIPYATEQDLVDILLTYKIDVRFVGEEYHTEERQNYHCKFLIPLVQIVLWQKITYNLSLILRE